MRTVAPAHKAGVIAQLVAAREEVLRAAEALPHEQQGTVFLGSWSPKDLLAHLQGWDVTNLQAVQEILSGQLPGFYTSHDHDWTAYNAQLVVRYRQEDFTALLAAVKASHQALVDYLQELPAGEFDRDRGLRFRGYQVTVARLLEAEAKDERVHARQLRELALGSPGVKS